MRTIFALIFITLSANCLAVGSGQVPDGMIVQSLPEVRGEILRPKDWHYRKVQERAPFLFTISREDRSDYIVGLKQAIFTNVQALTGAKAEMLAANFIVSNKSPTSKTCGTQRLNGYIRYCLEDTVTMNFDGTEILMRVVHSILWSNESDTTVISVFGAPESEWASLEKERNALSSLVTNVR